MLCLAKAPGALAEAMCRLVQPLPDQRLPFLLSPYPTLRGLVAVGITIFIVPEPAAFRPVRTVVDGSSMPATSA